MSDLVMNDAVREWYKQIGRKGAKALSSTARSLAAKRNSAARWRLRKAKYGPSGCKYQPGWLSEKYPHKYGQAQPTEPDKSA